MLLKLIGSALLKKVVLAAVEVLVKRTDNTFDDEILEQVKKYDVI